MAEGVPGDGRHGAPSRARPRVDSVERTLAQVGDAWSFLILREAFFGVRRFDSFLKNLGAAPTVVTDRLRKLVQFEVLERTQYQDRPARFEYRLTPKGMDLYPAIVLLMRWGDRWLDDGNGAPLTLIHRPCGAGCRPVLVCDGCGGPVRASDMDWRCEPTDGS
jgi:DNA-binding HxlR family transcriptional regulator